MLEVNSPDGTRIATWHDGSGAPLLLVHGSSADHTFWMANRGALERSYDVWLMDRRGRGASGDGAAYSLAREAEDLAAVVQAVGRPVTVLGHSLGGLIALEAALISTNIRQLILYEAPAPWLGARWTDDMDARMQALLDADQRDEAMMHFCRAFAKLPEDLLAFLRTLPVWKVSVETTPSLLRETRMIREYSFDPERLGKIDIPVSIVVGSLSPPNFHESAKTLQAALPRAHLRVWEGHEHQSFLGDPEAFATLVHDCAKACDA